VIQSWRALQLLQKMWRLNQNSLTYCLVAASDTEISHEARLYFVSQFGSMDEFVIARSALLRSVPDQNVLDAVIRTFHRKGVVICKDGLIAEVEAGFLTPSSLVTKIINGEHPEVTEKRPLARLYSYFGRIKQLQ